MTDPRETLARIRKRADAATDGPWEAWSPLHVETPDRVLSLDGGVAYDMVHPDAEFIAASRTTVPRLVDALEKVLELHKDDRFDRRHGRSFCAECLQDDGMPVPYPCPTVTAITTELERHL